MNIPGSSSNSDAPQRHTKNEILIDRRSKNQIVNLPSSPPSPSIQRASP